MVSGHRLYINIRVVDVSVFLATSRVVFLTSLLFRNKLFVAFLFQEKRVLRFCFRLRVIFDVSFFVKYRLVCLKNMSTGKIIGMFVTKDYHGSRGKFLSFLIQRKNLYKMFFYASFFLMNYSLLFH